MSGSCRNDVASATLTALGSRGEIDNILTGLLMPKLSAKAEATRKRILEAADRLFYRHGYHATGLDAIIREAGITKGNFYYYFKTKEALATAVLEWHFKATTEEMKNMLQTQSLTPLESLFAMLDGIADRQQAQAHEGAICGCLFGNFTLEMSTDSTAVRAKVGKIFNRYRTTIANMLKQAKLAGEVSSTVDPDSQAHIVLSLIEGAILLDKANQGQKALPEAIRFLRSTLPLETGKTHSLSTRT